MKKQRNVRLCTYCDENRHVYHKCRSNIIIMFLLFFCVKGCAQERTTLSKVLENAICINVASYYPDSSFVHFARLCDNDVIRYTRRTKESEFARNEYLKSEQCKYDRLKLNAERSKLYYFELEGKINCKVGGFEFENRKQEFTMLSLSSNYITISVFAVPVIQNITKYTPKGQILKFRTSNNNVLRKLDQGGSYKIIITCKPGYSEDGFKSSTWTDEKVTIRFVKPVGMYLVDMYDNKVLLDLSKYLSQITKISKSQVKVSKQKDNAWFSTHKQVGSYIQSYHKQARKETCATCMGSGIFKVGDGSQVCPICYGKGYKMSHYY